METGRNNSGIVCLYGKNEIDPLIIGPDGLRAPCALACGMRSLAIVITIVQSFSLSPPSFAFYPLRGISRVRKICFPQYFGITILIFSFLQLAFPSV